MKKKNQIPTDVTLVRITKRKCHKNIQPHIVEGDTYVAVGHDCKDSKRTLLITNSEDSKKVWRISDNRFDWVVVTMEDAKRIYDMKRAEATREDKKKIFNQSELATIYSRPAIIMCLIQRYADLVIREAACERLLMFKTISRKIKNIIEANDKHLYAVLGVDMYKMFMEEINTMYNEHIKDFTILYYSMNNIIKKHYPDYPYDTIRTNALIVLLLIDMHKMYLKSVGNILKEKFPDNYHSEELVSKEVLQLRFLLGAYVTMDRKADFNDIAIEHNKKIVVKIIENVDVTPYTERLVI